MSRSTISEGGQHKRIVFWI